jgi:hypothetical protein
MKYKVKSQLDYIEKGGILDDCGPSSVAAAVAWAAKYQFDPSAGDGIKAKFKATGQVDKDGVSDNGSSLPQLIATAKVLGATARYAKSWQDVVDSGKRGAGIGVWVQQPIGYPAGQEVSAWHVKWAKYWSKKDPSHVKAGYGHMTSAGWDPEEGWQWCCPTRSGKGAEEFAVKVTEEQLRAIADSKRVSKSDSLPDYKHCIIIEYPVKVAPKAETPVSVAPAPAPEAPKPTVPVTQVAPKPVSGGGSRNLALGDNAPTEVKPAAKPRNYPKIEMPDLSKVDWEHAGAEALETLGNAAEATKGEKNPMKRLVAAVGWIFKNTQVDEALLDALRAFVLVSISVALGLGIPLLDIQGGDFRVILSAGLASALQTVVKFLDPNQTQFGIKK